MYSSTKWLIAGIVIFGAALALLSIAGYPLLLPYQWREQLHIFGAIIFVGNINGRMDGSS